MTGIQIQILKVLLFIVSGLIILSSVLVAAEDVVPLPPLPSITHDFLENCGTKLKPACGEAIRDSIYKKETLGGECCKQLIDEGRVCHDTFIQVSAPYYPEIKTSDILSRSNHVWNDCVAGASNRF